MLPFHQFSLFSVLTFITLVLAQGGDWLGNGACAAGFSIGTLPNGTYCKTLATGNPRAIDVTSIPYHYTGAAFRAPACGGRTSAVWSDARCKSGQWFSFAFFYWGYPFWNWGHSFIRHDFGPIIHHPNGSIHALVDHSDAAAFIVGKKPEVSNDGSVTFRDSLGRYMVFTNRPLNQSIMLQWAFVDHNGTIPAGAIPVYNYSLIEELESSAQPKTSGTQVP